MFARESLGTLSERDGNGRDKVSCYMAIKLVDPCTIFFLRK